MHFLARWARRLSWKETAHIFGVSWDCVCRSVQWLVAWGLAHRDLSGVTALGIDELHWGKGKKSANFVTVIYQIDAGCRRLLWVGQRRTEATLRAGLRTLESAHAGFCAGIRTVCSDMWKPYLKVLRTLLSSALNVLDPVASGSSSGALTRCRGQPCGRLSRALPPGARLTLRSTSTARSTTCGAANRAA